MAKVSAYKPVDFDQVDLIADLSEVSAGNQQFLETSYQDHRLVFAGRFTYDTFGFLTGGTITNIGYYNRGYPILGIGEVAISLDSEDDSSMLSFALSGPDYVDGSSGADRLLAYGGNDIVFAWQGDDAVYGGEGNDVLHGQTGNDVLDGGPGADVLDGGLGDDVYIVEDFGDSFVWDTGGIDTVQSSIPFALSWDVENLTLLGGARLGVGSYQANVIVGNAADNTLTGNGNSDTLLGLAGDDWIDGDAVINQPLGQFDSAGNDIIAGGTGHDTVLAGAFNDLVRGEEGNDTILGEAGSDVLYGDAGYDAIDGGDGGDVIDGGSEADILFGAADNDTLYGGDGDDIMMGERNVDNALGVLDILYGGSGNDLMHGGGGDDWMFGADGVDVMDGGYGSDLIVAGPGKDIMLGSGASAFGAAREGNDLFVYTGMVDAGDQIWGFDTRAGDTDGIDLRALFDNIGYTGATPRLDGVLNVSQGPTLADTVVSIDVNGGGDSYSALFTLYGVAPATLTDSYFLFQ